jgi:hypothetical protein
MTKIAREEKVRHEWNEISGARHQTPGAATVNRFASVFIFLTDVEEGGEIFFPEVYRLLVSSPRLSTMGFLWCFPGGHEPGRLSTLGEQKGA